MQKPTLPKGTRDFSADQLYRRRFIFDTIRTVFELYGYDPLETPAMENLQTLTGKYGDEGDMLLFKVLNNGDFLSKADEKALSEKNSSALVPSISKRALRYDLTVPFARHVVMNQHMLHFPFKRYQMQTVWRADRPQKGRYQEFYQCDADVVGSESLLYEAEFASIYDDVFTRLGLKVDIRINNRKLLAGIAELSGMGEHFQAFTVALDKLDKIGEEGVIAELEQKGLPTGALSLINKCITAGSDLALLRTYIGENPTASKGLDELDTVFKLLRSKEINQKISIDITLARGLNYYTGCIFEVKSMETEMGSIGGGGRYDDLTGTFGLKGVSGVGISFGAERIFDILDTLDRWPSTIQNRPLVIVLAISQEDLSYAFEVANALRTEGVRCDVYPDTSKFKKAMKYASDRGYRYTLLCGEQERANAMVACKDMDSGEQVNQYIKDAIVLLKSC